MNLIKFNQEFPDEESCRQYLKAKRDGRITCKRCGNTKHYWLNRISKWECAECKSRTNLKSGTLFEHSKIKLLPWFQVIHLMTATKKSLSGHEIYRQINPDLPKKIDVHYSSVWYMIYKVREIMGKRDRRYKLQNEVELDHAFFEVVDLPKRDELGNVIREDKPKQKRGVGSQRQMKVLVMVESKPNPQQRNPHKKKRAMGFVKMAIMEEMTINEVNYEVERSILPRTKVNTDKYSGYGGISALGMEHHSEVIPAAEAHKKLPWVHTVIANSKRLLLGAHHSVGRPYLQGYLNEFCYKLNRRQIPTDLFTGLISTSARDTWY